MRTPPKNLTTGSSFEKDETAIAHPIHKAEREVKQYEEKR